MNLLWKEEKRYGKDAFEKYKEELKQFYRIINGKIKHNESVARLKEN